MKTFTKLRLMMILVVLTVFNIVNVMDRTLLAVLAEPIKREFHLSDTQLGLLAGMAFALVYGFLALPLARIADRGLYRPVIAGSLFVWSVMTLIGGFTQTFWQLAFMRVGVAGGEAGLNPASHALISRLFSANRRGLAIGIFSLGVPLGVGAGAALTGAVAGAHGWRAAFFVIGPAGLALLPLIFVLPRFPVLSKPTGAVAWATAFQLFGDPAYLKLWIASALGSTFGFGAGAFLGPFMIRDHHMAVAQVGLILGGVTVVGTGSGAFIGSVLFHITGRRKPGYELYPAAIALVGSAIAGAVGWWAQDLTLCLCAITVALFGYGLTAVPTLTAAQNLAPIDKRAGASALMGLSTGVAGSTCGPLLVGLLSDGFHQPLGQAALPAALTCLAILQLGGACAYGLTAQDLRRRANLLAASGEATG